MRLRTVKKKKIKQCDRKLRNSEKNKAVKNRGQKRRQRRNHIEGIWVGKADDGGQVGFAKKKGTRRGQGITQ